jgi:hypothetical protein
VDTDLSEEIDGRTTDEGKTIYQLIPEFRDASKIGMLAELKQVYSAIGSRYVTVEKGSLITVRERR